MKTLALILFSALAAASEGIQGYETFVPLWEVEVSPGGPVVTLNGTIQEVHAELLELNPHWDEHYVKDLPPEEELSLEKRTDFTDSAYFCFYKWGDAHMTAIQDGIKYLRGVKGRPKNGPGPANCGRVSCSNNSGIWWCNDARQTKELESFGSIADGAAFITKRCSRNGGYVFAFTAGQVFHKTNWNVIVRGDKC